MDLTRLRYFSAVAQAGSFSRAAAALHLSQPALSRQVLLLETELGQRLLERTGRGAQLTESGAALLEHANSIFALAAHAQSDMAERLRSPRGRINIGLPPRVAHVIAADLVLAFRKEFPDATISIEENLSIRLREWLLAGRVDLALMFDPPHSPQLMTETLLREPMVFISNKPLPARIRLTQLVQRELVMARSPNALRSLLEAYTLPRGLSLRLVAEVDSVQTVLSLVARGVGDTLLPLSGTIGWNYPQPLHVAHVVAPAMRNNFVLAVPRAKPATRLTRFVEQLLREMVEQHFGTMPAPRGMTLGISRECLSLTRPAIG